MLDFLAAHPSTLGKDYAGIGTALLYSIARVAGRIQEPLVWDEATALSAPFYRRVLDVEGILDHPVGSKVNDTGEVGGRGDRCLRSDDTEG